MLAAAQVALPNIATRVYTATHRFLITQEVVEYITSKSYEDFDYGHGEFEDPAFFQDDILLLGTISHEDYVVMLLDEVERQQIETLGFNFWCEWTSE